MKFDLHFRASVHEQIEQIAAQMKSREEVPRLEQSEEEIIHSRINTFAHTTQKENLVVASVSAGGDFPTVTYGDTFIYLTIAHAVIYGADAVSKLREIEHGITPLSTFTLISDEEATHHQAFDDAFSQFAQLPLDEVIAKSDYQTIKASASRKKISEDVLLRELIRPQAGDAGNIAIQFRSAAEWGLVRQIIRETENLDYVLMDGTLSLPSASLPTGSLFYEHLKRLCCVEAHKRNVGLITLSRYPGIPWIELVEKIAREKVSPNEVGIAEHWYLRLPISGLDSWRFSLLNNRKLPPAGAVSYLIRFHRNAPLLRLDMDLMYWREKIGGSSESQTIRNEQWLFQDLDYLCHDQRYYGLPYPLYSASQRVVLTKPERTALRKQIIDAAVKAGMKRNLFREISTVSPGQE
jgi:hypothetical protein